ncbi:MAG: phosphoribosylformylglycinamidine cyclo-ligase [Rhodospirillales bacterium]|nr:phosphoribosylformylglycinamidine cyclo-ligase [Rhodospirillales bacterium]
MSLTYKDSGVNIAAGNALVDIIRPLANATNRKGVASGIGGFGGIFDPKAAGFIDPLLVSATDGVGTKLKLAIECNLHKTIGVDLVAMCVNDLVVQGAEPLMFLDYFATAKLRTDIAAEVISGIAEGCKLARCALIGGETAEMPGLYKDGDYDIAGFAVGAVEREKLLPNNQNPPIPGDMVIGLPSNGLHSNGFSLVRHVIKLIDADLNGPSQHDPNITLVDTLLKPTRIYVTSCLNVVKNGRIKALAHITGGGLLENIPRVLPSTCGVKIDGKYWNAPPIFKWLQKSGNITDEEMARTFNCGIGMIVIVKDEDAERTIKEFINQGEMAVKIGKVTNSPNQEINLHNLECALDAV